MVLHHGGDVVGRSDLGWVDRAEVRSHHLSLLLLLVGIDLLEKT